MSTSETPETPPLTRRQLRELRNTGATPIISPLEDTPVDASVAESTPDAATPAPQPAATDPQTGEPTAASPEAADAVQEEAAPEPPAKKGGMLGGLFGRGRADKAEDSAPVEASSTPEPEPEPPVEPSLTPTSFVPAAGGDLGVTGLTRRQVREQERIRTASVPIIAPDLDAAVPAAPEATPEATLEPVAAEADEVSADEVPANEVSADEAAAEAATPPAEEETSVDADDLGGEPKTGGLEAIFRPSAPEEAAAPAAPVDADGADGEDSPVSTVNPALGSHLLAGETPDISLPPSFDQLIERSAVSTGSVSMPSALILSQAPAGVPLVGPVTATGEIIVTGTFELPEGLGSVGHAPGTTDGRDVDAVLLDGELPPASSPTPIAASAAISTVKQPGEIIRPPAPEKGSKLVVGLIITTGALAVAVAVALVLAFTTGVFG